MKALLLLAEKFGKLVHERGIDPLEEIYLEPMGIQEAIGDPTPFRDFPLLKGKEKLVQADFRGSKGQAFTSCPLRWHGTVGDVLTLEQDGGKNTAIFIASLNAVGRSLGLCEKTIHCRNEEPEKCAGKIAAFVKENYFGLTAGLVGYQPAITNALCETLGSGYVRVIDLDPENIGRIVCGSVTIENGETALDKMAEEVDLAMATGSTIGNGSLGGVLDAFNKRDKAVFFYGTTIACAAELLNLNRLCFEAK